MDTLLETPEISVFANARADDPRVPEISIIIPSYKYDASRLIRALAEQSCAQNCELLLYDDGSALPQLTSDHEAVIGDFPGSARLLTAASNRGRSAARNALIRESRSNWVLLLDADMLPDSDTFLEGYADAIGYLAENQPAAICGGFSLDQATLSSETELHVAQSLASECLPAETRQISPGLHIFTSNALVHKTILDLVPFDDGFTGWGWEDVDWGIRIAEKFPIHHIDNTATHLGLDRDEDLMRKYGGSGSNFAHLIEKHPQLAKQMTLAGLVQRLSWLPFPAFWAKLAKRAAASQTLPIHLRLKALKAFRAFSYVRDRS